MSDVERLAVKLAVDRAGPRDLASLRSSLAELSPLARALDTCPDPSAREALGVAPGAPWIDECKDLHARLASALVDDPPVRASDVLAASAIFAAATAERSTEAGESRQSSVATMPNTTRSRNLRSTSRRSYTTIRSGTMTLRFGTSWKRQTT